MCNSNPIPFCTWRTAWHIDESWYAAGATYSRAHLLFILRNASFDASLGIFCLVFKPL